MRLPSWLLKSSWSLLDQVSFAVANFGLNILLARNLSVAEYGMFSLVFSIYVLITTIHTALISEPMLVFGASRYSRELEKYLAILLRLQWIISIGIAIMLLMVAVITLLIGQISLGYNLLALAIALPTILGLISLRRATYLRNQQHLAGLTGVMYMLLLISGTLLATHIQSWHAFLIMGLASLCGMLLLGKGLWLNIPTPTPIMTKQVWGEHWSYGRWSLPANLLSWVPWNFPYITLAAFSSVENTAYLRSYMNLVLPVLQLIAAMNTAIVPVLGRRRHDPNFRAFLTRMLLWVAMPSGMYWLLIGIGHTGIVGWLYSGRFIEFSNLLWILTLLPLIEGQVVVLNSRLRALEQSNLVFFVYLLGSVVTVLTSIWFAQVWNLTGLVWSMFCAFASMYLSLLWITFRKS